MNDNEASNDKEGSVDKFKMLIDVVFEAFSFITDYVLVLVRITTPTSKSDTIL